MSSNFSRRDFLAHMGTVGVAASLAGVPRLAFGQTGKALLQPSDFAFAGAFRVPQSSGGMSTSYGQGLAYRYVGGQLRFLSTTYAPGPQYDVYEMSAPTPAVTNYPTASVIRHWGNVYQGQRYLDKYGSGDEGAVYGLFWDASDQRLYWSYGDGYNASNGGDCSLGYSTLDDAAGTATGVGAWRFSSRGEKMCRGGVLPIPQWFATQYCGGKRLGVGFGGYYSGASTGPASLGPALAAFSPPNLATNPNRSSLAATNLVGYPFNTAAYTTPDRAHRDTDYSTTFDGWNPKNGVGYYTWNDTIWQSAAWIDLPTKHGLVYAVTLGNGVNWYELSDRNAERGSHAFHVYDPADLALVAQGAKSQDQIQPRGSWLVQYPGLGYPLGGWRGDPTNVVTGMTFDPATSKLYVMVKSSAGGGFANVYVYQLSAGAGTAPTAPSNLRITD